MSSIKLLDNVMSKIIFYPPSLSATESIADADADFVNGGFETDICYGFSYQSISAWTCVGDIVLTNYNSPQFSTSPGSKTEGLDPPAGSNYIGLQIGGSSRCQQTVYSLHVGELYYMTFAARDRPTCCGFPSPILAIYADDVEVYRTNLGSSWPSDAFYSSMFRSTSNQVSIRLRNLGCGTEGSEGDCTVQIDSLKLHLVPDSKQTQSPTFAPVATPTFAPVATPTFEPVAVVNDSKCEHYGFIKNIASQSCARCPLGESTLKLGDKFCVAGRLVPILRREGCSATTYRSKSYKPNFPTGSFDSISLQIFNQSSEKMIIFKNPSSEFLSQAKSVYAYFTISGFVQKNPSPDYNSFAQRQSNSYSGWRHIVNISRNMNVTGNTTEGDRSFSVSFPSEIEKSLKVGQRVSKLVVRVHSAYATEMLIDVNSLGCSKFILGDYPVSRAI